ncbi:MAG: hypothetical protein ACREKN_00975 [Longimicrobiaceae bacterium]
MRSKPLGSDDVSGAEFVRELLAGDPTYAVNFDRIQWDSEIGRYVMVEFLLCEEEQCERGVTPHTSHPNRYFHKNARKFISLWTIAHKLDAVLYLVNYARAGTRHQNEVRVMKVQGLDAARPEPVGTRNWEGSRAAFGRWFRALNRRGAAGPLEKASEG